MQRLQDTPTPHARRKKEQEMKALFLLCSVTAYNSDGKNHGCLLPRLGFSSLRLHLRRSQLGGSVSFLTFLCLLDSPFELNGLRPFLILLLRLRSSATYPSINVTTIYWLFLFVEHRSAQLEQGSMWHWVKPVEGRASMKFSRV